MAIPRVECVSVDSTSSVVDIQHEGVLTDKDLSDLEQALDEVVIVRRGREFLSKVATRLGWVRL